MYKLYDFFFCKTRKTNQCPRVVDRKNKKCVARKTKKNYGRNIKDF